MSPAPFHWCFAQRDEFIETCDGPPGIGPADRVLGRGKTAVAEADLLQGVRGWGCRDSRGGGHGIPEKVRIKGFAKSFGCQLGDPVIEGHFGHRRAMRRDPEAVADGGFPATGELCRIGRWTAR